VAKQNKTTSMLVLAPTRELAMQSEVVLEKVSPCVCVWMRLRGVGECAGGCVGRMVEAGGVGGGVCAVLRGSMRTNLWGTMRSRRKSAHVTMQKAKDKRD